MTYGTHYSRGVKSLTNMSHECDDSPPRRNAFNSRSNAVVWVAFLLLLILYVRLHAAILGEFLPVTLREAAFIVQTNALRDASQPPMYSWASIPEQANLYGPLYPTVALPLVALLPDSPYLAHRVTTGFFLIAASFLLGWSISRRAGALNGWIGAVLFYAANVASPSLAAGPDTLATALYVLAILVVLHRGCTPAAISVSFVLGLLALLTKPYAVLAIPGLLVYLFLFKSPKAALASGVCLGVTCLVGYLTLQRLFPAYAVSVFGVHAAFATRSLARLTAQVVEFSYLHYFLLLLFFASFPWRQLWGSCKAVFGRRDWRQPLLTYDLGWDRFMALVAGLAILGSLGWHGGAHLIYFNHLLLPPLLLASLSGCELGWRGRPPAVWTAIALSNALLLGILLPADPKHEPVPQAVLQALQTAPRSLIDPLLEPYSRLYNTVTLVDNGEAEYLVQYADWQPQGPLADRIRQWECRQRDMFTTTNCKYILLCSVTHAYLHDNQAFATALNTHYRTLGSFRLYPYYAYFRNRAAFGNNAGVEIVVLERQEARP